MQKNEAGPLPYTRYKNDFRFNLRPETIKLLQENRRKSLVHWIEQWFLAYNAKSTGNKVKNRQIELHQTLKVLCLKGNSHVKRQPMRWKKIMVNHISDKELIYSIRNFCSSTIRKKINEHRTWIKTLLQRRCRHVQ